MSGYPVIEHEGHYASVTTQHEPTGRWMARLKGHVTTPHRVPNDYPSEEKAVLAAYDFARELINRGEVEPF